MFVTKGNPRIKTSTSFPFQYHRKTVIVLFMLLVIMTKSAHGKTIFDNLIPDLSNCPSSKPGEYDCLCYRNVDCDQTKYLECIDGRCTCEFPKRRTFDQNLGRCVSLVGSYCGVGMPDCVRNSECDGGRCLCHEGYSRTSNGTCLINFAEECGPHLCNHERGLACKESVCQCLDSSYVYSAIHSNCLDPEAMARNIMTGVIHRIVELIINFKITRVLHKVTAPLRFVRRIAFGAVGFG